MREFTSGYYGYIDLDGEMQHYFGIIKINYLKNLFIEGLICSDKRKFT